jgi:DNA repair exonuclease SbcCD ATPase subunit
MSKPSIETEEGQIAALAHQAHAAQHLRAVIENKDELNKLVTMLDSFSTKHAETLEALEQQKAQLKIIEETGAQLDERRLEMQELHAKNVADVTAQHEQRMKEFNAHVEKKYDEISGAEKSVQRRQEEAEDEITEHMNKVNRLRTDFEERLAAIEEREETHRQNVKQLENDRAALNTFANDVAARHEKVTGLERAAILKG